MNIVLNPFFYIWKIFRVSNILMNNLRENDNSIRGWYELKKKCP